MSQSTNNVSFSPELEAILAKSGNTPATASTGTKGLSDAHQEFFLARAINPDHAQAYTVTSVDELPEELQFHAKKHGDVLFPGIVFEHVDVRGAVTNQYRPDAKPSDHGISEEDGWGKYLFAKGAFNGPFIHRSQLHLIGKTPKSAVIEGSAQLRAAVSQAVEGGYSEEILFIGIPGCTGGLKEGQYSHDWDTLLMDSSMLANPKDSDTIVIFDKDVATNRNVHAAAEKLVAHLKTCTGGKVRIANVPAYTKTGGLDDYLAGQVTGSRPVKLLRLMDQATAKMPSRPAATATKRKAEADMPIVDFEKGITSFPPQTFGDTVVPGRILMHAAARIDASYAEYNDLDTSKPQTMRFDLEVSTMVAGELRIYVIGNLTTAELENPRRWLDRLPSGVGANVSVFTKDIEAVIKAIRFASSQRMVDVVRRSGLKVDKHGVTRFMDSEGAVGPDDKTAELRGKIGEETMAGFILPDPHKITAEDRVKAFQHVLAMWDITLDKSAFLLCLGPAIMALHGIKPKGTYGAVGPRGSGKTTVMDMVRSLLGNKISMANFEASPGAVGQIGAGCHNLPVFVDDFQDLSAGGKTAVENNIKAINMLLRRGYGGADYARSRLRQNRDTGEWETEKADPSSPFFFVTMERKAIPYGAESSMDRMLLAQVTKQNSFATTADAHKAMEYARSPLGNMAYSLVAMDVLERAAKHGVYLGKFGRSSGQAQLDDFIQSFEDHRHSIQEGLQEDYPGIEDPRRYEVASTPVQGVMRFLLAAVRFGAITQAEADRRTKEAKDAVMAAALAWQQDVIRKGGGSEGHLAKLSDSLASGNSLLADTWRGGHVPADGIRVKLLGWHHTYRGEKVVVLIPSEAARICGTTTERLEQDLAQHLVCDASGNRKPSLPSMTATSGKQRLWAVKLEAFDSAQADFDENDHSSMPKDDDHG